MSISQELIEVSKVLLIEWPKMMMPSVIIVLLVGVLLLKFSNVDKMIIKFFR